MKDLYMFGVNIAKADSHNKVYCEVLKAIKAGIQSGKKSLRIVCTAISDSRIATGPWPIPIKIGDHPDDQSVGVVFNTGFYDLSTVTVEERMSFMKGAMEKFGKLALYYLYNIVFQVMCEANHYYIIADLNYKFRLKFDFERRNKNEPI